MEDIINDFIKNGRREVLIIGDIYNYRRRMSNNFIKFIDYLRDNLDNYDFKYFDEEKDIETKKDKGEKVCYDIYEIIKIANCKTSSPIVWVCDHRGCWMVSGLNKYNGIKILDIEDLCGKDDIIISHITSSEYNYVFYKIENEFMTRLRTMFPLIKYKQYDHYIDEKIFRDYNLEKEYDVICYGTVDYGIYPFRERLFKLLKEQKDIKVKIIEHPRYGYSNDRIHNIIDKNLAIEINKAKIGISTPSVYEMFLKKYIEIGLCGCCLAGRFPKDKEEEYRGGIIDLKEDMSDDEILNKIKYYLKDSDERIKITKHMKNILENRYTFENGRKMFMEILEKI